MARRETVARRLSFSYICIHFETHVTHASSSHKWTGASYYISSKNLTVQVYQGLVDRGWRRSGTILYKPDVLRHCCPHYTIRLPAASFTPAKDHRQVVNRWNRYVLGDEYIKDAAKIAPKSKEEKKRQRNTFNLVSAVHEAEYANVKAPLKPIHRFEVTLEPDDFTKEKFGLFKNYQQTVHHEAESGVSENGFERFLCSSPLERTSKTLDGKVQQLGSFHQCYRLDGRLIAMSVLDLLPHCVSGVYFIYHSDFEKWGFGKLSAMRETALALEGGYQYYYMGFYIHSCLKMRYKGEYRPSYILDPETYEWNPLDGELRELLDSKPYVSLSRERRLNGITNNSPNNKSGLDDAQISTSAPSASLDDYPFPTAEEAGKAVQKGMSLFDLKIPGVMTAAEVGRYPLDHQAIKIRSVPNLIEAEDLLAWSKGDICDSNSLKGTIAELVACLGPDVAKEVVVGLG